METEPQQVYEIVGLSFEPCGAPLAAGSRCASTRRFAVRRTHIGLYCGGGPQAHHVPWLPSVPWASPSDFVEPGPFAGWVPADAFPVRTRTRKAKRSAGWDCSESIGREFEVRVRQRDAKCLVCDTVWFRGERNSIEALRWLHACEQSGLYAEVADAIGKLMPKPTLLDPAWYDRLPIDLRLEVSYRFDDSCLRPEPALSIGLLRAAKVREGPRFSAAVQRFGVDGLALPACDKCRRAKGALLFETRSELLARWSAYRFAGSVAAASSHPDFDHFEYLAHLAYETDLAAGFADRAARGPLRFGFAQAGRRDQRARRA